MFYSHEILTSREGGIATVWLVATLGSKTNNRKVNRKSILEVDVQRTCNIIIQPEAPMALRLQGNLLYGVTRVFSRQCEYIISDAQATQANIRLLLKVVKTSELDPNAGKAHPDQLMIQDDPAFLPDLALPGLDIDLSALDISTDELSRRSSILSPHSQRSSLSSGHEPEDSMLGLVIPSSATGGGGEIGGFQLHSGNVSSARGSVGLGRLLDEDDGFDFDPGFAIDSDGNLTEDLLKSQRATQPGPSRIGSDIGASARVRQGLLEGRQAAQPEPDLMDLDLDLRNLDGDDLLLPTGAQPFPAMASAAAARAGRSDPSSEAFRDHGSSETVEAPLQRKKRVARQLPVDQRQELHNAELEDWKNNYLANMTAAKSSKAIRKATATAKKNAAYWVTGLGIGGVGAGMGSAKVKSPLDVFAGPAFLEALAGSSLADVGRKRTRPGDDEEGSESEGRNVRARDDDGQQFGRGDDNILQDDDTAMTLHSEGVEVGRHAQPPLEDPSMPWNISASSRQGSLARSRGFQSSIGGFPTSAGGPGSVTGVGGPQPGHLDRRASRLTSASPLVGRDQHRYSSLELPMHDDDPILPSGEAEISDPEALEGFELYGPGAAVDTQTAAQTQWANETLTHEASNFLEFVSAEIAARAPAVEQDDDELSREPKTSITFEELLPPAQHSKLVGAQGFYHVLALASSSRLDASLSMRLDVKQKEGFGPIELAVVAKA